MRRFSVFTQRSLGDAERVELAPAAELSAEHRADAASTRTTFSRAARPRPRRGAGRDRRRRGDPGRAARLLGGRHGRVRRGATSVPSTSTSPSRSRRRAGLSLGADAGQEHSFRAQRAEFPSRTLAEAEGELEKLIRSGYRTVVAFEGRGEAERTRFNLSRLDVPFLADRRAGGAGGELRGGAAAGGLPLAGVAARRDPPAPPDPPPPRRRAGFGPGTAGRSDRAARRRLRRPRGPRGRPLLRLRHQDAGRRHAGLPGARVPRRRPRLRPDRPARPDQPLRRRRRGRAAAQPARGEALAEHEVTGAPRGQRDGGRPDQPLRRAPGPQGSRLLTGRRAAAHLRGGLPLSRDRRPDGRDRRRQGRHGVGAPDGPADLRRRRLRQDGDRAARRPQGRGGRQAGDDAGADHDPRPAAFRHLPRALRGDAVQRRDGLPAAQAGRGEGRPRALPGAAGSTS